MGKGINFTENDNKLIKHIEDYQKANELPSFVSAVRELCKTALKIKEVIK